MTFLKASFVCQNKKDEMTDILHGLTLESYGSIQIFLPFLILHWMYVLNFKFELYARIYYGYLTFYTCL